MAIQVFNLRGVPDDEAQDICDVLAAHHIEFYETPAGRWGMSSPGIWINDDAQREHALALIATYQAERAARARREYEEQKARGEHSTWRDVIRRHPVRFVGALLAAAFVVYVTVGPFLRLAGRD